MLMLGPVGTGKTSVAQGVLQKLDPTIFNILTVNLSAQVSVVGECGLMPHKGPLVCVCTDGVFICLSFRRLQITSRKLLKEKWKKGPKV